MDIVSDDEEWLRYWLVKPTIEGPRPYVYAPLKGAMSVRFVRLLPGTGKDVKCEIIHGNIKRAPHFAALSYTWDIDRPRYGYEPRKRRITCDTHYELDISANLYNALKRLRNRKDNTLFWIDAICVDQEDVQERGHQVSMMGRIYSSAQKLIIWLGDNNMPYIVEALDNIAAHSSEPNTMSPWFPFPKAQSPWRLFQWLLECSWFKRMWVLQELVLGLKMRGTNATTVLFGDAEVRWEKLITACRRAQGAIHKADTHTERLLQMIDRVLSIHNMAEKHALDEHKSESWVEWLSSNIAAACRRRLATDPRDYIFALYGLCGADSGPKADYTLSPKKVFLDFAWTSLGGSNHLDILHAIGEPKTKINNSGLPSWVPDWRVQATRVTFTERVEFAANKTSSPRSGIPRGSGAGLPATSALRLAGDLVDRVSFVSQALTDSTMHYHQYISELWLSKVDKEHPYPTNELRMDCYLRTLVSGINHPAVKELIEDEVPSRPYDNRFRISRSEAYKSHLKQPVRHYLLGGLRRFSTEERHYAKRILWSYEKLLERWTQGRVFTTERGYMGMGVSGTAQGDVVSIFRDARTPFVIRELKHYRKDGNAYFSLVGEAYVHGWMNGEMVGEGPWGEITLV